jgi:hypothetical protein
MSVVRSVDKDRSLNLEATFPKDAYHPVITVAEGHFPVDPHSQSTDLDEGSSVGRTPFGDISVAATKDIIRCSTRLAKKKTPLTSHGLQFCVDTSGI